MINPCLSAATQSSAEFFGVEEQFAVAAGVFVGLGEIGGLRGIFDDAVCKDLDAGDVEIGDALVTVAGTLNTGEFGGGIFRQNPRESGNFRNEFAIVSELLVSLQDVVAGQGIEPRGDAEGVIVL